MTIIKTLLVLADRKSKPTDKSVSITEGMINALLCALLTVSSIPAIVGFGLYDDDKRQDMIPIPRVGRTPGYFQGLADMNYKRQGLIPFPRVGRSSEEDKRQDLIPFPRVGRNKFAPFTWTEVPEEQGQFVDYFMLPYKRSPFTPRLGRRKRSINDQGERETKALLSEIDDLAEKLEDTPWAILTWNGYQTKSNQHKRSESRENDDSSTSGVTDVRRSTFKPRLGRSDHKNRNLSSQKPFTPRLGRSPFTPRMGRSVTNSKLSNPFNVLKSTN
ncbi:Uncharacterised protein g1411 [Pycnogonum litorale]